MTEAWTVLRLLKWSADYFAGKGVENGRLDAELLLAEVLGLNRVGLYLNYDRPLQPDELAAYKRLVERRARREPVAYILGRCEFWSLEFAVGPAVLIPRADTETLVEAAMALLPANGRFLDVGTGSGAIAVALAANVPGARGEGIDISPEALAVAAANVARHGLADRLQLREGDLFALDGGGYDLVVANPPYIGRDEAFGLMPEVRDFEPHLALFADGDALICYRALAAAAPALLNPGGHLLVEVGSEQSPAVQAILAAAGLEAIQTRRDLAGIERVVIGRNQPAHA